MAGLRLRKPVVVTIGAMKSATSSLHAYMALHPEIHMSWVKETDFFKTDRRPPGGLAWYRAMLTGPGRVVGETSPNYTKHTLFPGVPERMHAVLPEAKLLYIVRDPVARALSHYRHNRLHGREQRDVSDAFAGVHDNHYVATSRYAEQAERFLQVYDADALRVLDADRLRDDAAGLMHDVFAFVGVDATFTHPDIGRVHHDSSDKQAPNAAGRLITDVPVVRNLRFALPQVFERPLPRIDVPDDVRARIAEAVADDAARLRELTGLPFAGWSV